MAKAVLRDKNLTAGAKGLYAYLSVFCDSKRECYPSRALIADELGITKDTLGKLIRELVNAGYLEITHEKENGRFSRNRYCLTDAGYPDSPYPVSPDTFFSYVSRNMSYVSSWLHILSVLP